MIQRNNIQQIQSIQLDWVSERPYQWRRCECNVDDNVPNSIRTNKHRVIKYTTNKNNHERGTINRGYSCQQNEWWCLVRLDPSATCAQHNIIVFRSHPALSSRSLIVYQLALYGHRYHDGIVYIVWVLNNEVAWVIQPRWSVWYTLLPTPYTKGQHALWVNDRNETFFHHLTSCGNNI